MKNLTHKLTLFAYVSLTGLGQSQDFLATGNNTTNEDDCASSLSGV